MLLVGKAATQEQQMHRAVVKHASRIGVLVALVLAVGACGGGDRGEEAQVRSIPKPGKALAAGQYASEAFNPALSFKVGNGWLAAIPETQDALVIGQRDVPLTIGFLNVAQVFDPSNPGQKVAAPEDMAAWLQDHPRLDTEEPGRVTVSEVSGQQFDAIASEPTDDPPYCPEPCVSLFALSGGEIFWLGKSEKYRFIVLENVEGQTVTIIFGGPAVEFEEFLSEAQKVLDTVEWKGA
jgi:hypothetical protein